RSAADAVGGLAELVVVFSDAEDALLLQVFVVEEAVGEDDRAFRGLDADGQGVRVVGAGTGGGEARGDVGGLLQQGEACPGGSAGSRRSVAWTTRAPRGWPMYSTQDRFISARSLGGPVLMRMVWSSRWRTATWNQRG